MSSLHLIDPDGDVELLLSQEVEPLGDRDITITPSPSNLEYRRDIEPEDPVQEECWVSELEPEPELEPGPEQSQVEETPTDPDTDGMRFRIRVSSKHLMSASSYFKRSLGGELTEGHTLRSEGHVKIEMNGQDLDAMLIVMNMIHGRFRQLPSSVDLSTLTRIAVLTDYLQCHEVAEPFVDQWIERVKGEIVHVYSKELIQWLCISQVFKKEDLFKAVTRTALRQARDLIDKADLPIWDSIENELNRRRSAAIEKLFSGLTSHLQDLLYDRDQCGYECNALRYGILAKELTSRGLHSPRPQAPFLGYSFENITSSIVRIDDSPCLSLPRRRMFGSPCISHTQIDSLVEQAEKSLDGLSFETLPTQ